jgi:hypothetical protein
VTRSTPDAAAWRKLGVAQLQPPDQPWFRSHAALPVVAATGPDGWDVLFSARDADGRSHVASATLTGIASGHPVLAVAAAPALRPGALGTFDDAGTTTSCVVPHGGRQFLYYTGWSRGVTVPFYLFAGLAIRDHDGPFQRVSAVPVLDRSAVDPLLTASPWVLVEGGVWRMWYVSAARWEATPSGPRHYYHIRYAESADGVAWRRDGRVCIDFASPDEYAFGRPCVVHDGGVYRMWYCVRGAAYRIGYAESRDGLDWTRMDHAAGIEASATGWDSEMMAYPVVMAAGAQEYMLYNGNDYGRTGIGLAVRERAGVVAR